MKTITALRRGFSLIEVSLTLAVVSFALIGILGVLPVAMQQSRSCVDETRAAQMAKLVFNTLQSEPFNAVRVFSVDNKTIDLATQTEEVKLYASYDVRQAVTMVRLAAAAPMAEYEMTLSFEPTNLGAAGSTTGTTSSTVVRGTMVRMTIRPQQDKKKTIYVGAQFIARTKQGGGVQ